MEKGKRIDEESEALDTAQAPFKKAQSRGISTNPGSLAEAYQKYKKEGPLWELPISRASALKAMLNGLERTERQYPDIPQLNEAIERNRADYRKEIDGLKNRFSDNVLGLLEKNYRQEQVDAVCEAVLDFENLLIEAGNAKKFLNALSFDLREIRDTKKKIDALLGKSNIRIQLRTELKKERARLAALERLPTVEIDPARSFILSKEFAKRSASFPELLFDPVRYNYYYLRLITMSHQEKGSNLAENMFYEALQIIIYKLLTRPDMQVKEACQRAADLINDVFKESGLGLKTLESRDIERALNSMG